MIRSVHLRLVIALTLMIATVGASAFYAGASGYAYGVPILIVVSFVVAALAILLHHLWIARPVHAMLHAMDTDNTSYAQQVLDSGSELGRFARLVIRSLENRKALLAEISERRRAENDLRESEERYRRLLETSPDAFIVLDSSGSVLLCNKRALDLFGYSAVEDLLGKTVADLVPEPERDNFRFHMDTVAKKDQIRDSECRMVRADGEVIPVEMTMSLLRDSEGSPNGFVGLLRDISSRKKAELEKVRLEEQFRAVYKMEAVGQLAGGVAHDFNNILGAVSGYADMIRQRYAGDERLEKYSGMILSAATRAADLTNKLLTFARKGKLQLVSFNLNEAIRDAAELLEHSMEKNIRIVLQLDAADPIVIGDSTQIQSAIMNLSLNARDAMPGGGDLVLRTKHVVLDEAFVKSRAYMVTTGPYVQISVTDTGIGMDKQVMARLFEPFFTTKELGKGTGLGLASVYGTVKSHNGYIDVTSEPGKGSSFTIYLPSAPGSARRSGGHPAAPGAGAGKGHILVIDDESFLRDALREMLLWLGYTVKTCADGQEAIDYYRQNHAEVSLVVLDMIMPGIDGRECFRQLREIDPGARVLLSTGYSVEEERQSILKEGIVGIIQKPFISAQLAQAVHKAINS